GRAARRARPEHAADGTVLGDVVARRGRAVQVDVVDAVGGQARVVERGAHRGDGARAFGVGRAHVVAVVALAGTEQPAGRAIAGALEEREGRGFADGKALALRVPRPARLGRQQLERVEAVERR